MEGPEQFNEDSSWTGDKQDTGAWPEGRVRGLRARGGFGIDMDWAENTLTLATIRSTQKAPSSVYYQDRSIIFQA